MSSPKFTKDDDSIKTDTSDDTEDNKSNQEERDTEIRNAVQSFFERTKLVRQEKNPTASPKSKFPMLKLIATRGQERKNAFYDSVVAFKDKVKEVLTRYDRTDDEA